MGSERAEMRLPIAQLHSQNAEMRSLNAQTRSKSVQARSKSLPLGLLIPRMRLQRAPKQSRDSEAPSTGGMDSGGEGSDGLALEARALAEDGAGFADRRCRSDGWLARVAMRLDALVSG